MCLTDEKVVIVSDMYCVAKNKPVKICKIRQMPNREPEFHPDEMFDGQQHGPLAWVLPLVSCVTLGR